MTIAIHKGKGKGVWCDRRSPLGNPFHLANESQRDAVCDAYQAYFEAILDSENWLVFDSVSVGKLTGFMAREYKVAIAASWQPPHPKAFLRALDRLASIYQTEGAIVLRCWCIKVEIKSRADLVQPKRCHCLSLAGYLLPKVNSFAEQLSLGV